MLGSATRMLLCVGALMAATIGTAPARAQVPVDAFDAIGDANGAPDIGKVLASVLAVDANRVTVRVGTWLDHSELTEDEEAHWTLDLGSGGSPTGADLLFQFWGHDGWPDTWQVYKWQDTDWVPIEVNNSALATYPDGRVYWQLNIILGNPANPGTAWLRAYTGKGEGAGKAIDRAPNDGRLAVSLSPHGNQDPLEGCTWDGGCVGGAAGVNPGGVGQNPDPVGRGNHVSASCLAAQSALNAVNRKLSRARSALRRARTAAAKRRARARVRSVRAQHASQQRVVDSKCH